MADAFNHLVVLMLENRSFDHMLGRLYHHDNPAPYHIIPRGQTFDGVQDNMSNPTFPPVTPNLPGAIQVSRAVKYNTPSDFDVGHQFADVRLQIDGPIPFGSHMTGFVASRIADLEARNPPVTPSLSQLREVMAGFSPTEHTADGGGPFAAAKVISELAQNFAVCDNWHASVPGPTFPNRSFLHAGTSNGLVSNAPASKWKEHHALTIFNRMAEHKLTAKIYHSGSGPGNFPALVYELHPPITRSEFPPATFDDFLQNAKSGDLPQYSFIEPCIIGNDKGWTPNDQHPTRDIRFGEDLIQQAYEAVRKGPKWNDTFLIICYDEHGGFFDHRDPPNAVAPQPLPSEEGFTFDRFGIRIPAVLVSPRIEAGTVFHPSQPVDHTSVIKTICARWGLPSLTLRDLTACDLSSVLGHTVRTDAPVIAPVNLPATQDDLPLNDLQQDYIELVAANRGAQPPELKTEQEGRDFLSKIAGKAQPGIAPPTPSRA